MWRRYFDGRAAPLHLTRKTAEGVGYRRLLTASCSSCKWEVPFAVQLLSRQHFQLSKTREHSTVGQFLPETKLVWRQ